MIVSEIMRHGVLLLCLVSLAPAQLEPEVPLMTPSERKAVDEQSTAFNKALEPMLKKAARSTVRIWGKDRQPLLLAYGTVVGDGSQVLTKWSEIERFTESLQVQAGENRSFQAEVEGVYIDEDLALLKLVAGGSQSRPPLVPAEFQPVGLTIGRFLAAPQPSGAPGAFGVVSVLERNLRETDQAHLGIMADPEYKGQGVRIATVQAEYGAAEAGLRQGDVILKVEERSISGLQELRNVLSSKQPGDRVNLRLETAGKEKDVEVRLSNRPLQGQFAGNRLNQMESMGGRINRVRSGFSRVVQSDMQIQSNRVGGPVVDLQGRVVGITLARADRTRTYVMSSAAVMGLLGERFDSVAEAQVKSAKKEQLLATQQRELIPQARPRDVKRMQRNLSDLERLAQRIDEEMQALEGE